MILSDTPWKKGIARFTTVLLKPLNKKISLFKHVVTHLNSSEMLDVRWVQSNLNAADL